MMLGVKCPHCGSLDYKVLEHTSTTAYYPIVLMNGLISNDGNKHTYVCECVKCGQQYQVQEKYGVCEVSAV